MRLHRSGAGGFFHGRAAQPAARAGEHAHGGQPVGGEFCGGENQRCGTEQGLQLAGLDHHLSSHDDESDEPAVCGSGNAGGQTQNRGPSGDRAFEHVLPFVLDS